MVIEIPKNIHEVEINLKKVMLSDSYWSLHSEDYNKHFFTFKENTIFPFNTNLIVFHLIEIDNNTTRIVSRPVETKAFKMAQKVAEKLSFQIFSN